MRAYLLALPAVLALSGCAAVPAPFGDADCRHVLAHDGSPLRFCESDGLLTIDNSRPQPTDPSDARLIDDPAFLRGMVAHIEAERSAKASSQPFKSAPPGYITIAESDFVALVRGALLRWSMASAHMAPFYPR